MKNTELLKLVEKINSEPNFDKAQGMLEMLNDILGTKYGFLAKCVVRFDNPDGSVAERYAHAHDLRAELSYRIQYKGDNYERK